MLELYHNGASTCSQKVRMILAEKGLDYTSHPVDLIAGEQHAPAYIKLNPNHVVPTLVDDGAVLIESTLINEYLDEAFPEPPMRPWLVMTTSSKTETTSSVQVTGAVIDTTPASDGVWRAWSGRSSSSSAKSQVRPSLRPAK